MLAGRQQYYAWDPCKALGHAIDSFWQSKAAVDSLWAVLSLLHPANAILTSELKLRTPHPTYHTYSKADTVSDTNVPFTTHLA